LFYKNTLRSDIFLVVRSSFLHFSPECLVSSTVEFLFLFRLQLLHFSSVFSVLYVHVIVSTSRPDLCLCFVLLILFGNCF
jgi:hypothetical protein